MIRLHYFELEYVKTQIPLCLIKKGSVKNVLLVTKIKGTGDYCYTGLNNG